MAAEFRGQGENELWYGRGVKSVDPHVRGHFDKPTDRFDPRKGHSVSFTIKPGRKLKRLAATFAPVNECKDISVP